MRRRTGHLAARSRVGHVRLGLRLTGRQNGDKPAGSQAEAQAAVGQDAENPAESQAGAAAEGLSDDTLTLDVPIVSTADGPAAYPAGDVPAVSHEEYLPGGGGPFGTQVAGPGAGNEAVGERAGGGPFGTQVAGSEAGDPAAGEAGGERAARAPAGSEAAHLAAAHTALLSEPVSRGDPLGLRRSIAGFWQRGVVPAWQRGVVRPWQASIGRLGISRLW